MKALLILTLIVTCSLASASRASPMRVAITQELFSFTPYSPGISENLLELVYDKLAGPSPYLANATPWLAESIIPEGDDGKGWIIKLRSGIKWHDGKAFTAKDVAFTFSYYRDGPANRWTHHVSDTPKLTHIEVIDPNKLRIRCEYPCPYFDRVTAADLPILPEHIWKDVSQPHLYSGQIVGTGPFQLVKMQAGRYIQLEANPHYFGGNVQVKSLLLAMIPNPVTAFTAIRAGEFDIVASPIPPELIKPFSKQNHLEVMRAETMTAVEMRMNFDREPFINPKFRRALAWAVNPKEILNRVGLSTGRPGDLGYPHPDSPWTAPGLSQAGSKPQKAVKMLNALGFIDRNKDGFLQDLSGKNLSFSIQVASNEPLHLRAAQVIARQIENIGIRIRVESTDQARQRSLFFNRQFDLMIAEISPHGLSDPDQLVQSFRSGYLWRAGKPNSGLDTIISRWLQAHTPETRLKTAHELQRFHSQEPTTLVLYYPSTHWVFQPKTYKSWLAIPGHGIFHKWSLLQLNKPMPGVTGK